MMTRIRTCFLLIALCVVGAWPAQAQVLTGSPKTITSSSASCLTANCLEVSTIGVLAIGINVEGSGTYTLQIEGSKNTGTTWYALNAVDESGPSALVTSISAAGNFSTTNLGITNLRIRASALSAGTPVVTLTRGSLPPLTTLGGTGSAGTEYTESATDASITGVAAMMEGAANTLLPIQGTVLDGLLVNLGANNDVTVTSGSLTANAGTNLNTSLLALESGGNLDAIAASLAALDNTVAGTELQVDVLTMPTVTVTGTVTANLSAVDNAVLDDIADGIAVSCSNCTGSGASDVEGSTFALGTDSVAPAGFYFDDVAPTAATEDRIVLPRVSGNRNMYSQIRDGAGNERGAIVTANNELLVELGAGAASIGTLGANSGVDIGDVTLTAGAADIGNVNLEIGGTAITAGVGAVAATTPRMTLASDDPAVTSLSAIAASVDTVETIIGTTNSSLTTIDGRVDGLETLLGTTNTSLAIIDNIVFGPGTEAAAVRVTLATDSTGVISIDDNGGAITVDGSISCSNCTGSGASGVDDGAFAIATDSVAPAGFLFDDVAPDSVDEGDVGLARMSANRVPYSTIRDAAGNERGANVNASNQLTIAGPVTNAGTFAVQVDGAALSSLQIIDNMVFGAGTAAAAQRTTLASDDPAVALLTTIDADTGNLAAIAASLSVLDDTGAETADEYLTVRLTDGTSFLSLGADWTVGTAIGTGAPGNVAVYSDFDGAALPTITNVDTEGEAVPIAASIKGVQYMMLVSEDGSLQYGTATTPLVVGDGSGVFNVIVDSITGFPDNEPFNVAQINGVTVLMGNGATGTGSQRVTLANDNTIPTGWPTAANQTTELGYLDGVEGLIGTTNTNTGNVATAVAASTTLYRTSAGTTEDEWEIKATAGVFTGGLVTNTAATVSYLKCYNLTAANTTPGTSAVFFAAAIPAQTIGAGFNIPIPPGGVTFSTAFTCTFVKGAADTDVAEVGANEIKANLYFR